MEVYEALKTRRSIRKYQNKPVEKEKLDLVLDAARTSPSSGNKQQWKFVVADDKSLIEKLTAVAGNQAFVKNSPVVIAACGPQTGAMNCQQQRNTVDLSIACSYMMLEAHNVGLGTCWLGNFQQEGVKKLLGIPESWDVVVLLTLGYPDESPAAHPAKAMEEIVSYNHF